MNNELYGGLININYDINIIVSILIINTFVSFNVSFSQHLQVIKIRGKLICSLKLFIHLLSWKLKGEENLS